MSLLDLIKVYPQFVPYIIINDIAPFNQIIRLTQTCKEICYSFYKIKTYVLLCKYHLRMINMSIFAKSDNFYMNQYEKQLFQKIYKYNKNKLSLYHAITFNYTMLKDFYFEEFIKDNKISDLKSLAISAAKNNDIDTLNKLVNLGYLVTNSELIDVAAEYGHLDVFVWFDNYIKNKSIDICFSTALDNASNNRHINILNWLLEYRSKVTTTFCHFSHAINKASAKNNIDILNWWLNQSISEYGFPLYYNHHAIDEASGNGKIDVLNWWLYSGLDLKYSEKAIDNASYNNLIHILDWWLESALKFPNLITLEYSKKSMDKFESYGDRLDHENKLNWWLDKSKKYPNLIKLKYSEKAITYARYNLSTNVLEWWLKSGLEIKYPKHIASVEDAINEISDDFDLMY